VKRFLAIAVAVLALARAVPAYAADEGGVTKDDYKTYMEYRAVLTDERVQALPADKRVGAIAQRNFKMKGPDLQAIIDRVEAAGGSQGIEAAGEKAVKEALAGTELKDAITEVRLDVAAGHIVTYVTWTSEGPKKVVQEGVLLALKAGQAAPLASTLFLWAKDSSGATLWRAKVGQDRVQNIRESRIGDWAITRYLKLFEVEVSAPEVTDSLAPAEASVHDASASPTAIQ
jgi:hypothetical protein